MILIMHTNKCCLLIFLIEGGNCAASIRLGCCEHNMFVDFLKLFDAIDMDGSFLMLHVAFGFMV
jgi:hypothetical protein